MSFSKEWIRQVEIRVALAHLTNEILEIVIKENPEIVSRAIINTVDKNPELFKEALEEVLKKHDCTFYKGKDEQ